MILLDDVDYYETLDLLRGRNTLPSIFIDLKAFVEENYSVTVANFIFEIMKHDKLKCRHRLNILLMSDENYIKMLDRYNDYGIEKQKAIAARFIELNDKYIFCQPEKLKNLFVWYTDFRMEMRCDVNRQAGKEAIPILTRKYGDLSIWGIIPQFEALYVFFERNSQAKEHKDSGIFLQIKQEYYQILKKYDEFDVFSFENFIVEFDSKETVDRDYSGNLYYYFK